MDQKLHEYMNKVGTRTKEKVVRGLQECEEEFIKQAETEVSPSLIRRTSLSAMIRKEDGGESKGREEGMAA